MTTTVTEPGKTLEKGFVGQSIPRKEDRRLVQGQGTFFDDVHLEISVLTEPEIVIDPAEIVVGRDGLIVEEGARKGLLLPQVAPEHGWDREAFLNHTCVKAGLPPDAWRKGATIWRFHAEVFSERG